MHMQVETWAYTYDDVDGGGDGDCPEAAGVGVGDEGA